MTVADTGTSTEHKVAVRNLAPADTPGTAAPNMTHVRMPARRFKHCHRSSCTGRPGG